MDNVTLMYVAGFGIGFSGMAAIAGTETRARRCSYWEQGVFSREAWNDNGGKMLRDAFIGAVAGGAFGVVFGGLNAAMYHQTHNGTEQQVQTINQTQPVTHAPSGQVLVAIPSDLG